MTFRRPQLFSWEHPIYPYFILINVCAITFLAVFSVVSTMIADDLIRGELALSRTRTIWITTLYLLGLNTTVPIATWFSDHYGYKRMYAIGVSLFTFGSLLAAVSVGFFSIATARTVEGAGAGLIFPVGLALLIQNFPKDKLPLILSLYISAAFGAGLGLGLPIAGYLAQFITWRAIFWLLFPCSLAGLFSCWMIHEERAPMPLKGSFDIWGIATFSGFIVFLLIALTLGPLKSTDSGWLTPYILFCFAAALLCLIANLIIESRHPDPVIPIVLFKDPGFSLNAIAMFLLGMSIFASVSVSTDYMLHSLRYEKFVTGKIAMIYGVVMAACSIFSSLLIKWKVPVLFLTLFGLSLLILSYFLNNRLDWQTGPVQILQILLLRGMGVGLSLGPVTVAALTSVPKELSNKAATLLTFFRQVGGTYGGTILAIISIKRTIFHAARFGEQASQQIPGYRETYQQVFGHSFSALSASAAQAKGRIVANIETQAYIQGQNDALIVFGYITAVIAILLLILNLLSWWNVKKSQKNRSTQIMNGE